VDMSSDVSSWSGTENRVCVSLASAKKCLSERDIPLFVLLLHGGRMPPAAAIEERVSRHVI